MVNEYDDCSMMNNCVSEEVLALFREQECDHPLDEDVTDKIKSLMNEISSAGCKDEDKVYEIFRHSDIIDDIWLLLLEKAIKCLRYHDPREPFEEKKDKKPQAYGLPELKEYYKRYKEFENMLYGSNRSYRDHIVHVFRVWLSGVNCMVKYKAEYLNCISIRDDKIDLNQQEKLSIWTIIALTHDLGYPLERAKAIIKTTHNMASLFVTSPTISMDLSFHGVQNYMNDFILRLMSSKMIKKNEYIARLRCFITKMTKVSTNENTEKEYVARLQPKYYFKFQKSLERMDHGILSTLIIYKLLAYFLDSDYSINEDYKFTKEERRQFYIRREILRAIATHTCKDIFHLYMGSFAFLLIVADDTQEWGRKSLSELYIPSGKKYYLDDIKLIIRENNDNECNIKEEVTIPDGRTDDVIKLLEHLKKRAVDYVRMFRDGQDTRKRDFSFSKNLLIRCENSVELGMKLQILKDEASSLRGEIKCTNDQEFLEKFVRDFKTKLEFYEDLKTKLKFEENPEVIEFNIDLTQ